ncbi:haloacid dehalogenase type II [Pseudooceanicola sp. C21-150M6]|uniref:haloacid dehalogenase type II n=1 Tax=Pseudooceanicola sp. C21-150M6 TaxID=3434355 RepID=UPI003D7FD048
MPISTCVFDAYGTLFDVAAAARAEAERAGPGRFSQHWPRIAEDWRRKQLEYSWLRAIAGHHCTFWEVTQDALDWALEAAGFDDPDLRQRLMELYRVLDCYPEVPQMLRQLRLRGMRTAILSNGSPDMLDSAVASAGIGDLLDDVLSVESVQIFKPAAAVYDLVGTRFGCAAADVLFVSSNGWDAAAASAYGFHTVWVNRRQEPVDRLFGRPDAILPELSGIPELEVLS